MEENITLATELLHELKASAKRQKYKISDADYETDIKYEKKEDPKAKKDKQKENATDNKKRK